MVATCICNCEASMYCCYDNIGALCDVYKFIVKDLIDFASCIRELIWHAFSSTL